MKNLPLKLTAFLCAILLWIYVAIQKEYQIEVDVPIRYDNLNPLLAFKIGLPSEIHVTLKGKGLHLYRERQSPGFIRVNLQDFPLGKTQISMKPSWYQASTPGVQVVQIISQSQLLVDLDTKISKTFAVQSNINAQADEEFVLISKVKLNPDSITLRGSRRLIRQIKNIETEPIILEKVRKDIDLPVKIRRNFGPAVDMETEFVQASWKVDTLIKKKFKEVPIALLRPTSEKYFLSPQTATITLTGAQAILNEIKTNDLNPFIEFNRFQIENKNKLSPNLKLYQEIKSYQIEPNNFQLDSIKQSQNLDNKPPSKQKKKKLKKVNSKLKSKIKKAK